MAAPQPAGRRENAFTRHIGPLPTWAWVAIVAGAILLWAWYERSHGAGSSSSGASSATQPPEVIQTTPPEINIDTGGPGPEDHHRRHRPRTMPGDVNPGGLNDPGPAPHHPARKPEKRLPTVHRKKARHPGTNRNVPRKKKKPVIQNATEG